MSDQENAPVKPGWRDRVVGMRGVAGVAAAALIIGGAGGFAIGAVSDDGDGGHGNDFRGGPGGHVQQGPGHQGRPGPPPGGTAPGLPPQDDEVPPESQGPTT